jgi:hypothetical protein
LLDDLDQGIGLDHGLLVTVGLGERGESGKVDEHDGLGHLHLIIMPTIALRRRKFALTQARPSDVARTSADPTAGMARPRSIT